MTGFLVVGEALVDVVEEVDGRTSEHPGGSPANVALGLARLGRSVDLLTWLAADRRGQTVLEHLEGSGVGVLFESLGAPRTSTARARLDATGAATYEFDLVWRLVLGSVPPGTDVLHTGSVAATATTDPPDALVRLVHDARAAATVTYDPNLRPSVMGRAEQVRGRVDLLVSAADVVKVSDEDLAWLHPGTDPLDVASAWVRERGCALVVVTRGAHGASAVLPRGRHVTVPAPATTVADTVGAGDAFMSGLLTALDDQGLLGAARREDLHALDPSAVTRMLDFAALVAAHTVSRPGADPPTLAEVAAGAV